MIILIGIQDLKLLMNNRLNKTKIKVKIVNKINRINNFYRNFKNNNIRIILTIINRNILKTTK